MTPRRYFGIRFVAGLFALPFLAHFIEGMMGFNQAPLLLFTTRVIWAVMVLVGLLYLAFPDWRPFARLTIPISRWWLITPAVVLSIGVLERARWG
jgi:hypothetical protein